MLKHSVEKAVEYGRQYLNQGKVATYIPEIGKADRDALGMCVRTLDGEVIQCGDCDTRFTMQSCSKVVTLIAALEKAGFEEVFSHVMMEPSGDSFNSIIKLDIASNKPFNPMINAGAIAVISLLISRMSFDELTDYARELCMDKEIELDQDVYHSEADTGNRNRAIGYLLKSKNVLEGSVDATLDYYFRCCSLKVNAVSLANLAAILANGGVNPITGKRIVDSKVVRTVKTLMFTFGMYDGSGDFAVRVGLPAKSGVGGGIIACAEKRMGIGTYGPALDEKGNSIGGKNALNYLSNELGLHVFN